MDRLPRLHWAPLTADRTVSDGDLLDDSDGLRAIHDPGHSPGHIVLFHEPSRAVLMGDAAFNRGKLALGPAALAADPDLRPGSLARIPYDLRAVGFAHGPPSPEARPAPSNGSFSGSRPTTERSAASAFCLVSLLAAACGQRHEGAASPGRGAPKRSTPRTPKCFGARPGGTRAP
ncbi:MBL fold metallo-hydrolase [Streptomyces sp. NPDC058476]|uniref:MBL fold metallo-hydrolase n=1 Tax=Streptomyces sp. NPDC058476 TaxID=3346519 RepID=UPI0036546FF7